MTHKELTLAKRLANIHAERERMKVVAEDAAVAMHYCEVHCEDCEYSFAGECLAQVEANLMNRAIKELEEQRLNMLSSYLLPHIRKK